MIYYNLYYSSSNRIIYTFNFQLKFIHTLDIPSNERSLIRARHYSLQRAADRLSPLTTMG